MKALVVDAEWSPKKGYNISDKEIAERRAFVGSQVWKNTRFEIKDVPVPNLLEDELLIRVKRCGICGTDTHLYETDEDGYILFSGPVRLPCITGHEYSGIVEKTGKGVINFKVGDRVAVESILWCGKCTPCRGGAFNQCENVELSGVTDNGAMAEFIKANERHCWSINSLSEVYDENDIFNVGALIEPVGCSYNGIFVSGGGFKPGAVVTVFGVGPIGLASVALARIAGAGLVIAFDRIEERLEIAKKMGADMVFNLLNEDIKPGKRIIDVTGGHGADIQVEAAGNANIVIPEMEASLAVNGKIIYLGRAATSTSIYLDILVSGANKIIGSRGHSGYGIYSNIIRLLESGRLKLDAMITSNFDFKDIMTAFKRSSNRRDGKILVKVC